MEKNCIINDIINGQLPHVVSANGLENDVLENVFSSSGPILFDLPGSK